jgi:peptidyl-prolyl cis-trans isomerase B (cyclophilin B)
VAPRHAVVALTGLAMLLAGCVSRTEGTPSPGGTTASAEAADGESCDYREEPGEDAPVGLPPERAADTATKLTITSPAIDMTVTLDADSAPCTVRSIAFLAEKGFYDGTRCHRMVNAPQLKVLQCGDPEGDGTGGPGYTIPDENPEDLAPAGEPDPRTGEPAVRYPRGAVAMANTGTPHSGGSQFFVVFGDSVLPPTYAVFGNADPASLTVLDGIAAMGIVPGTDPSTGQPSPEDGAPVIEVEIAEATVR